MGIQENIMKMLQGIGAEGVEEVLQGQAEAGSLPLDLQVLEAEDSAMGAARFAENMPLTHLPSTVTHGETGEKIDRDTYLADLKENGGTVPFMTGRELGMPAAGHRVSMDGAGYSFRTLENIQKMAREAFKGQKGEGRNGWWSADQIYKFLKNVPHLTELEVSHFIGELMGTTPPHRHLDRDGESRYGGEVGQITKYNYVLGELRSDIEERQAEPSE